MADDVMFNMRINSELKTAFLDAAKRNDRPAAQLIRDFMREYVKANPPPKRNGIVRIKEKE
ncbi:hypothetical protein [Methylomagnum sp.]